MREILASMSRWGTYLCLGLALLGALVLPATGANARQRPASIVIDANTGRILQASAADERRYPASLTKMMTIYLVFEHLKNRRLKTSTLIQFSRNAAQQPPSKLGLKPGQSITVANALRALVTKSANDVATAVAEHIAGSESSFAEQMTAKARALGMRRTVFRNASGLPDAAQYTTARDMATLGLALQNDFPKRYRLFSTRRFVYAGRRYTNHNRLLGRLRGTDGIKTGYTRASGFNITTNVRRDGKHLIGVVIGRRTGRIRDAHMRRLLTRALPRASATRKRRRAKPQLIARPRLAPRPRLASRSRAVPRPAPVARPRPATLQAPRNSLGRSITPAPFRPYPKPDRVRQPSTFGEQVARLQDSTSAQRPIVARGGWAPTHHVQIGAFHSEAEAHRALSTAQARAGDVLHGAQPMSVRVEGRARPIFRARFAGFDSKKAAEACSRLRSLRVDCFVARAN